MNDEIQRENARGAIRARKLPNRRPDKTWGGFGADDECAICGAPVSEDQLEMELEFSRDDGGPAWQYHVHVPCYQAWDFERQGLEVTAANRSGSLPDTNEDCNLPGLVGQTQRGTG